MIRVTNLTKRYGSLLAVDGISFEVERGGVVGFLGPNGAGKSTTLRVVTCYHPATSGSASVAGFDVFEAEIDEAAAKLWGITDEELKAIQDALKEM